ncbi:MAG TPA: hypothetical protein VEC99_06510, partial [Clostridia bacterium]|nr:hypothetical protein [Clostridia bacterium]
MMKTTIRSKVQIAALGIVLSVMPILGQDAFQSSGLVPEMSKKEQGHRPRGKLNWQAVPKDWCSTEWYSTESLTNEVTGEITERAVGRYIELADGLNYIDEAGQWRASQDIVEVTTNGAAAVRGPTKVYFGPNLNAEGAVTLVTKSNLVLRLRPVGLYYFDAESGESVQVAAVRDCEGELLPPNQLVFRSALDSLEADIRYTWSKGAFESDLVLLQKPKSPAAYGLNPKTTRLELWHVFGEEPQPQRTPAILEGETNPTLRASMAEPDLIDETLDFGDIRFPQGCAFSISGAARVGTNAVIPRPYLPEEERPG